MAKSVADAAIMFGAMESASPDPNDPATRMCTPPPGRDYTRFLKTDGLKGARIGIPRAFFYDAFTPPGPPPPLRRSAGRGGGAGGGGGNGLNAEQKKAMDEAIAVLKAQGAIIVDPADIPSVDRARPDEQLPALERLLGREQRERQGRGLLGRVQVRHEARLQRWLKSLGAAAPVKTLTELREWNIAHAKAGAIKYGQSQLDISDEMDVEKDRARYEADRAKDIRLSARTASTRS